MGIVMLIITLLVGYFIGSVPTSIIVAKKVKNIDIREHGSKNAGGTNVGRVLGKRYGALVIVIDMLKTIIAVWGTYLIIGYTPLYNYCLGNNISYYVYPVAIAVSIGHCFPIFASFNGGKAVSTCAGSILSFSLPITILVSLVFLITLKIKKYVSLCSILCSLLIAFLSILIFIPNFGVHLIYSPLEPHIMMVITLFVESIILIIRHRSNIKRLISGKESKIKWMK